MEMSICESRSTYRSVTLFPLHVHNRGAARAKNQPVRGARAVHRVRYVWTSAMFFSADKHDPLALANQPELPQY